MNMTIENPTDVERSLAHMIREATREDITETFGDAPADKPSSLRLLVRALMAILDGEGVEHVAAWVDVDETRPVDNKTLRVMVIGAVRAVAASCRLGDPAMGVEQARLKDLTAVNLTNFKLQGGATVFGGWEVPTTSTIELVFSERVLVIPNEAFERNRNALPPLIATLNAHLTR
jgi:hypothetical protein